MPATEIPPRSPVPEDPSATPPGSDLYDAGSWESAYTEMHDVPALLIQLQDDLSRSRQREAFWISVVVHLAIVILVVNSTRFANLLHRHAVVVVSPEDLAKRKISPTSSYLRTSRNSPNGPRAISFRIKTGSRSPKRRNSIARN